MQYDCVKGSTQRLALLMLLRYQTTEYIVIDSPGGSAHFTVTGVHHLPAASSSALSETAKVLPLHVSSEEVIECDLNLDLLSKRSATLQQHYKRLLYNN